MIVEKRGNIVDDDAELLVCTTNCVGVMGAGVALEFKKRWPYIVADYKKDCIIGYLKPGKVEIYDLNMYQKWAAFCTKDDWRNPSQYEWVNRGLFNLWTLIEEQHIESVAMPVVGCGNGGLDWDEVYQNIKQWFEFTPYEVRVYLP